MSATPKPQTWYALEGKVPGFNDGCWFEIDRFTTRTRAQRELNMRQAYSRVHRDLKIVKRIT